MSFNLKYQTVSSDFVGWTTGTLPVVSITGANYGDTEPYTTFVIDFSPALPANVTAFQISRSRVAAYGATKDFYRMDQISPQKFSRIDIDPATLTFQVYGVGAGPGPSGNFVTYTAPSTVNAIPAFSTTTGAVSTATTTTPSTLSRPIVVSAGNVISAATFNTSNANCFVNISTTGTTTNRGAVIFGRSAVGQWTIGSDKDNTNSDNFFVFRNGVQALTIEAADQFVRANYGAQAPKYILTDSASNPGGQAIWKDTAQTRPSWTTLGQLALLTDIPAAPTLPTNNLYSSPTVVSPNWVVTSGGTITLRKDTQTGLTFWMLGQTRLTYSGAAGAIAPIVLRWGTVPTNHLPSAGTATDLVTAYPNGTPNDPNNVFKVTFENLSGLTFSIYPTATYVWNLGTDLVFPAQSGFFQSGTPAP